MTNAALTLYFAPLACTAAARAVLYELEVPARLVEVRKDGTTEAGEVYRDLHPLGLVPALRLEDGALLTENAAVLQYLADRFPARGLAPSEPLARARLQSWLSFIGTELHQAVFNPLLDSKAPPDAKAYALTKADLRLDWLAAQLADRATLLDALTVADAYLAAVLAWLPATPLDASRWPALQRYLAGLLARPAFARAFGEERALWIERNAAQARALGLKR